jgi:hypothetical protein
LAAFPKAIPIKQKVHTNRVLGMAQYTQETVFSKFQFWESSLKFSELKSKFLGVFEGQEISYGGYSAIIGGGIELPQGTGY